MNNRAVAAFGVVVGVSAGCGGKGQDTVVEPMVGMAAPGIGDCVDPAPATTRAGFHGLDDQGRIVICRDDGEECRAIVLATGAMTEHFEKMAGAQYDQPGAVVEDDGQLLVCWGQTSCLRRTPTAYETWMQVELADGKVAVLSSEADRRWLTTMDHALTTVLRFPVAPGATHVVWHDGKFLVDAAEDGAVHGYLYAADGTPRGVVGALGAGKALDLVADQGPVDLAPGWWGFLAKDASAVAAHDLEHGDGVRVELGLTDQPPGAAALGRVADRTLAVALGGAAYGDVLLVDIDARKVTRVAARKCEGSP